MHWQTIKESPESRQTCLNLAGYEQARASFSWNQAMPNDRELNIAYEPWTATRSVLAARR